MHHRRGRGDAAASAAAASAAAVAAALLLAAALGSARAAAPRVPLDVFQHHHGGGGRHPARAPAAPDHTDAAPAAPAALADALARHAAPAPAPAAGQPTVLYQVGAREEDLPECKPWAVCSKVDLYEAPWVERQCRCPGRQACSGLLSAADGHTLTDRTRHLKLCEPIKKLPKCRFFRDVTWTLKSAPNNATEQVVNCHCPKGAVAYLIKRQPHSEAGAQGFIYSFACSPQSRLRCQRKEPCRLFTVRKRPELLDEVNTNTLCQCPHGHACPRHHTEPGVIPGSSYADEEPIRTFSGYCLSPALARAAAASGASASTSSGPSH
ncbi:hypothetical protein R5R35_004351 [Gryllus longicercus]|uniref:Protein giant-lens n=1 Tax=Gryllus longicercus TaxID=2509291 RepID=A0AAN9VLU3_9ORTH